MAQQYDYTEDLKFASEVSAHGTKVYAARDKARAARYEAERERHDRNLKALGLSVGHDPLCPYC